MFSIATLSELPQTPGFSAATVNNLSLEAPTKNTLIAAEVAGAETNWNENALEVGCNVELVPTKPGPATVHGRTLVLTVKGPTETPPTSTSERDKIERIVIKYLIIICKIISLWKYKLKKKIFKDVFRIFTQ